MAIYIPNATQTTEPVESRTVESAALEFRTLKTSINARIDTVQDNLDTEIVNRIAGDANLQTQNNAQDIRLAAIENALLAIGEGGLPGTVYVQRFSGTGAQTAFTLNATPQSGNVVDIYINGLYQNKDTFSVAGAVITFSEAPPAGTDNIEVQVIATIALGDTDASLVTYNATTVEAQLDAISAASGSSLVGFQQAGAGAVVRTAQDKMREWVSVKDFGAVGLGADESAAANAMIAAHNYLYVPPNFTLVCKNLQLFNGTKVICDGTLKLPTACSDFDRLLYAVNKTDIEIDVRELDGNYAGQSGSIGTHLIYTTGCDDISINVKYAHDHYIDSGASMLSVDGIRNSSSGGIFVYDSDRAKVNVGLFEGWGREAIWLYNCRWGDVTLGHAQGKYTTEYSGLQVSGAYNSVNRASVDFAGASAVGFDTSYGTLSNVIATNTRENHGVNLGHPGFPATGSVVENIVVDGAFEQGIQVAASSQDVSINNFTVRNTGISGIAFSDGVLRGKLSNGVVSFPSLFNIAVLGCELQTANVRSVERDATTLLVASTSGMFEEGETVTSATGSAVVRRRLRDLTGAEQRLFFASVTGSFSVAQVLTGGTSGATATITTVWTPSQYSELSGGTVLADPRLFSGVQDQIRFPDGTAILTASVPCSLTAGGVLQAFTVNYSSNVVWTAPPIVTATVASVDTSGAYTLDQLQASSTITALAISLKASMAQIYGINIIAVGRWK